MVSIEKHSIKISLGVAVTVIIFLIIMAFNFATWKTEIRSEIDHIDTRQTHLAEKYVGLNERLTDLEVENTAFKVQMAEIQVQLKNIQTILLEIKDDLKVND
jgi:hypothetical protein